METEANPTATLKAKKRERPDGEARRRRRERNASIYTLEERPVQKVAPIVFVGGTGRSGTHVIADLLGRHGHLRSIPVECRFHVEPRRLSRACWRARSRSAASSAACAGSGGAGSRATACAACTGSFPGSASTRPSPPSRPASTTSPRSPAGSSSSTCSGRRAEETGAGRIVEQSCDDGRAAPTLGTCSRRPASSTSFATAATPPRRASAQTRGLVLPAHAAAGDRLVGGADLRRIDAGAARDPRAG